MMQRHRPDGPHPHRARRWTIGVLASSRCRRVTSVLLGTVGKGVGLRAEVAGASTAQLPPEATALFRQLAGPGTVDPGFSGGVAALRAQLADTEAAVVDDLLAEARLQRTEVLAVGVHDPGLWSPVSAASRGYLGLCDAARLAERTGLTVIDAFPARDVAGGGRGGPVTPMAEWALLRDAKQTRVLLDLGSTVRMSYLPAESHGDPASRILAFEVGPGMHLLDLLTERLTGGEHGFDPGGRFAVQGRRIPELLDHWLADPYFRCPLPRWHPRGVRPERFLIDSLQMAVDSGWSVRDLLCTATHFVAEAIARQFRRRLPSDVAIDQIVVAGGGQQNGFLLREIVSRLPEFPMIRIGDLGLSNESLHPACIAVLAQFHLDQVPANPPTVTGTEVPRVLGRLTPGSPQAWQHLLAALSGNRPAVRPLRSAL